MLSEGIQIVTPAATLPIRFRQGYKSIQRLPISALPQWMILTGLNGAGKTHFLQAVSTGAIEIQGVQVEEISNYNWTSLGPQDEAAQSAENMYREIDGAWGRWQQRLQQAMAPHLQGAIQGVAPGMTRLPVPQLLDLARASEDSLQNRDEIVRLAAKQLKAVYARGRELVDKAVRQQDQALWDVVAMISEELNCSVLDLSEGDFRARFPIVPEVRSPFAASFSKLFSYYYELQQTNLWNRWQNEQGHHPADYVSSEEFEARYGKPPWDIVNKIFGTSGLRFRISKPVGDSSRQFEARLLHLEAKTEIKFSELSSGERIIVAFALFLFGSRDRLTQRRIPKVLLLDEVDAPLHPSMARDLLATISETIIGEFGITVIMATHSPSTVALAPMETIHVMDPETHMISRVSKERALRSLMTGVPTLSVSLEDRRQIFVESDHDVAFYEACYQGLRDRLPAESSLSFVPSARDKDGGGCTRVKGLVGDLVKNGTRTIFGVVDWDLSNLESDSCLVLGLGRRYSIENYIFDPLLLAAFFLHHRVLSNEVLGLESRENYWELPKLPQTRLQTVSDAVLRHLDWLPGDETKNPTREDCEYVCEAKLSIPVDVLRRPGHNLEDAIKGHPGCKPLQRFHNAHQLKQAILDDIVARIPGLLSRDILDLFIKLQVLSL